VGSWGAPPRCPTQLVPFRGGEGEAGTAGEGKQAGKKSTGPKLGLRLFALQFKRGRPCFDQRLDGGTVEGSLRCRSLERGSTTPATCPSCGAVPHSFGNVAHTEQGQTTRSLKPWLEGGVGKASSCVLVGWQLTRGRSRPQLSRSVCLHTCECRYAVV